MLVEAPSERHGTECGDGVWKRDLTEGTPIKHVFRLWCRRLVNQAKSRVCPTRSLGRDPHSAGRKCLTAGVFDRKLPVRRTDLIRMSAAPILLLTWMPACADREPPR